jgi:hypothetical protein
MDELEESLSGLIELNGSDGTEKGAGNEEEFDAYKILKPLRGYDS